MWALQAPYSPLYAVQKCPTVTQGCITVLKDCTMEQKLVLVRRELPGCSAEEAASCLELCLGDVDAALANLSQA